MIIFRLVSLSLEKIGRQQGYKIIGFHVVHQAQLARHTGRVMKELNGTAEPEQQQNNQIQMMVNMQVDPSGSSVIVTATIGIISSTIVIPANLYEEFNTKEYLPKKRNRIQFLDSIRRSRND